MDTVKVHPDSSFDWDKVAKSIKNMIRIPGHVPDTNWGDKSIHRKMASLYKCSELLAAKYSIEHAEHVTPPRRSSRLTVKDAI